MRQLLESGVHFGHQTRRWNPKMKPFIFTARNDIHVIDLQKTVVCINDAYSFIREIVENNGSIMFVGTKKQAQEAISDEALRCKMPFVNQRWLGGTLTNNSTIRQSINKLKFYERDKENGVFDKLSKKEASKRQKTLDRLKFYLDGIKDMYGLPQALFVVDTKKEQLAIDEANKLGIPIIGLVDTNADPTEVQYPIPGNDDAIRAIKLICSIVANAVEEGNKNLGVASKTAPEKQAVVQSDKSETAVASKQDSDAKKDAASDSAQEKK
ncbi:30S ribosomal protein S2 [Candidatus Marinamargulisbacteria bacterium SCGC AG-439-L15]|nr:30S ribosomal protein S2 [Candidatus Marinamargulisbacteria bacterium SCGC AG-439-L15]